MKKIFCILALSVTITCFGQTKRKISSFLSFEVNRTLYDRTINSNASGLGFGLQTHLNTNKLIKPTLEINADLFAGTKIFYTTLDGRPIEAKSEVMSIFIGPSFQAGKKLFAATTFGTSFYNAKTHFGVRPSIGFYPSKKKNWRAKASFTNIFQRDDISNESFGYFSLALALKLF